MVRALWVLLGGLVAGFVVVGPPGGANAVADPAPRLAPRAAPRLGGVGLVLNLDAGEVAVVRVLGKASACAAGIRAGDLVERVDGRAVANLEDAVARLAGSPGSTVTIGVRRDGKARSFTMRRAVLAVDAVDAACP